MKIHFECGEFLISEDKAKRIVEILNEGENDYSRWYFKVVADDYKLQKFEP